MDQKVVSRSNTHYSSGGGGPGKKNEKAKRESFEGPTKSRESKNTKGKPRKDDGPRRRREKHGVETIDRSLDGFQSAGPDERQRKNLTLWVLLSLLVGNFCLEATNTLPLFVAALNDVLFIWKISRLL